MPRLPNLESDEMRPAQSEDPLRSSSISTSTPPAETMITTPSYTNDHELIHIVSELHVVDMNAEDMDPIEWTVRRLVPIPSHYYWDVVQDQKETKKIPTKIRMWHNTIAALDVAFKWTDRNIGQPTANFLGLTDSRFSDVTIHMNDKDWKDSKEFVAERNKTTNDEKSIQAVEEATSSTESTARKEDSISSVDYY